MTPSVSCPCPKRWYDSSTCSNYRWHSRDDVHVRFDLALPGTGPHGSSKNYDHWLFWSRSLHDDDLCSSVKGWFIERESLRLRLRHVLLSLHAYIWHVGELCPMGVRP